MGKTVYLEPAWPCSGLNLSEDGLDEEDEKLNSRDRHSVTIIRSFRPYFARRGDLSACLMACNPVPFAGNLT